MQGLAGQTNTSWQASDSHQVSSMTIDNGKLPKNLDQTLISLEDSFWYILNNPSCYCELIWRFFNENSLF